MNIRLAIAAALFFGLGASAQANCLVVGDSLAVGIASAMPECAKSAKVGASSKAIVSRVQSGYSTVIVSAGSNDGGNAKALAAIATRAGAARVIFVLPGSIGRGTVANFASSHGYRTVSFGRGVHPHSYQTLARQVRSAMQ